METTGDTLPPHEEPHEELAALRQAIRLLDQRVQRLEAQHSVTTAAGALPVLRDERAAGSDARRAPPSPTAPSFKPPDRPSLESRIGSQIFNRVGIVVVLIGVAWFLKYAVDEHWIGAAGRVTAGLTAGLALIAWSERFRSRGFPVFSFSLKAVGSGVLYLSLWAASVVFHLAPYDAALAGMALVTAGNAWLCLVQRSEVLAAFALTGGFLTPSLLGLGQTSVGALGAYLVVLNSGLFTMLAMRRWPRLLPAAFAGTIAYLLWLGWQQLGLRHGGAPQAATLSLAIFFFVVFSLSSVLLMTPDSRGVRAGSLTAAANALLGGAALWMALRGLPVQPWTACLEAAWLGGMLALGPLRRPAFRMLAGVHAGLAIVFATLGMWMALPTGGALLGWELEAAVLLWLAQRRRDGPAGGVLGSPGPTAALLLLSTAVLVLESAAHRLPPAHHVICNVRFGLFAAAVVVVGYAVRIAAQRHAEAHGEDRAWGRMGSMCAVLATMLLLLDGVFEMRTFWGGSGAVAEQFAISAWAALLGVALLVVGFRVRWAFLRWQALALLSLAIAKVVLFDTRSLTQGYGIVSFLGLGILLLCVSFIYQRDLLNLRGKEHGGD